MFWMKVCFCMSPWIKLATLKNFYTSFIFLLGILILNFFSTIAQTVTAKNDSAVLSFKEKIYDFGNVKQGESVTHEFKFKNTGTKPLVISDVVKGCGCTTPRWTTEPIMPGGEGSVWATFNSNIGYGHIMKPLHIYSNATVPQMDIYIQCELLNEKFNTINTDSSKNTLNPH